LYGARITAAHVYAAQMHDLRFRQMEGGLPEQFREEQELERADCPSSPIRTWTRWSGPVAARRSALPGARSRARIIVR
jgi:hypothetical protein